MAYSGRNNIYEAIIRRMVEEALASQEQAFRGARGGDTDEQLLAYLSRCAKELGHTPWPREIVGGRLIEERFGTWENALREARLPLPHTPDKVSGFARIQEETQRQKLLYRQKKAEKKLRAQERLQARKEKQKQPV